MSFSVVKISWKPRFGSIAPDNSSDRVTTALALAGDSDDDVVLNAQRRVAGDELHFALDAAVRDQVGSLTLPASEEDGDTFTLQARRRTPVRVADDPVVTGIFDALVANAIDKPLPDEPANFAIIKDVLGKSYPTVDKNPVSNRVFLVILNAMTVGANRTHKPLTLKSIEYELNNFAVREHLADLVAAGLVEVDGQTIKLNQLKVDEALKA